MQLSYAVAAAHLERRSLSPGRVRMREPTTPNTNDQVAGRSPLRSLQSLVNAFRLAASPNVFGGLHRALERCGDHPVGPARTRPPI